MDESILARNFITTNETVWQSAKTGVVLYAQSWKEILKTAIVLGFVAISCYAVLLIIFLVPAFGISGKTHPTLQVIAIIGAFVFAGVIKLAFLTLKFHEHDHHPSSDGRAAVRPAWEEKIEKALRNVRSTKRPWPKQWAGSFQSNPLKSTTLPST
jgi:hypothetical protein